jgi:hypothetical protein
MALERISRSVSIHSQASPRAEGFNISATRSGHALLFLQHGNGMWVRVYLPSSDFIAKTIPRNLYGRVRCGPSLIKQRVTGILHSTRTLILYLRVMIKAQALHHNSKRFIHSIKKSVSVLNIMADSVRSKKYYRETYRNISSAQ